MTTDIVHRILVAHPSDTPRKLLVDQLKSVGYRYVAAVTGARPALDILDHSRVDLVIAADKLDDMDVWAFVRTIRSGNLCPAIIPMIVVAANQVSVGSDTIAEDLGVRLYRGEQDGPLETVIESCVKQQPTRTVLVIEDDMNVGEVVQSGLGPYYQVETALDGEAGLRRWCQRRHTLILLDLALPKLSGEEVLEKVLVYEPTQPIIIITGHSTPERYKQLMLSGAADFVKKPFDVRELRLVCDRVWRHSALTREATTVNAIEKELAAADRCLESGRAGQAHHLIRDALSIRR